MNRIDAIRKFVASRPGDPFPRYGLAMELRRAGRLEEACLEFAELEKAFPDYVPLYLMYAQVLSELSRIDEVRTLAGRGAAVARRNGDQHAAEQLEALAAGL